MDQLEQFIREIIKIKNTTLDAETEQELVEEMVDRLTNQINRDIINALPEEMVTEINQLMDNNEESDKVWEVIERSGIDQQAIIARTMINFRQQYLGK
ncbi:MAG: hypothetical protein Q3996_00665 [Candidatus Saccharibacteria bacterium]|nr:hypothetical protein [Candidatus Saccharibacteria bacterium]